MSDLKKRLWGTALAAVVATANAMPAVAAEKVKVAIGQKGLWDTMVTVFGNDQGFFKQEGVEVEITWTKGGSETLQAALTGSVDFAIANGILGVLGAYAKGAPVRIVSAQMTGAPDLFWYAKAGSGIKSLKDAGGKTMGFSRPGSSTNLVALALASHYKVKPKMTPTGGISGTRTQVMSGQIDIGWSVPPFNLNLVAEGKINIVARGSDVPSLAKQTVRVNVANANFLAKRPAAAEGYLRGYAKTLAWMYAHQGDAITRFAAFNKVDKSVAEKAIKFYNAAALAMSPIAGMTENMQQAVQYKRLKAPLSKAQIAELVQLPK